MDVTDEILKNERYREIIDQLSNEVLELVAHDHIRALSEARKGIQQEEPEELDDVEYLEAMARAMQRLAQGILKERNR